MNSELYSLMLELEYKFDTELEDYFGLTEVQRNELTESLLTFFTPYIHSHKRAKFYLMRALENMVLDSELEEEYEKAEIFNRFSKRLLDFTF